VPSYVTADTDGRHGRYKGDDSSLLQDKNRQIHAYTTAMLYFTVWLGHIAAVAAQFDFTHTQYETSPPVYPSRK
jgi:hypothetical protein